MAAANARHSPRSNPSDQDGPGILFNKPSHDEGYLAPRQAEKGFQQRGEVSTHYNLMFLPNISFDRAPYGGVKLKIPTLLLSEKLRTQSRFNVSLNRIESYT